MTASQEMWRAPRLISVLNVCLNYSRVGKYHTGNLNFTLNFIESFKSEPRHRSDFHEGTPRYNNNNNVIINILDQIYASFKKLW